MKTSTLFLFSCLTISILISCTKDEENQIGTPEDAPVLNSLTAVLEQLAPNAEVFTIESSISSSIKTENFGRYVFPPYAFADLNGNPVSGQVEVSVTEYFNNSELFYAGLSTRSDDNWLVTGGQFKIEVTQNGQPLQIADGKSYQAFVPNNEGDSNMEVFLGEELPDGSLNWLPSTAPEEDITLTSTEADSLFCGEMTFILELQSGQVATFNYVAGTEDASFHTFVAVGPSTFWIDPTNPQTETVEAIGTNFYTLMLSDLNYNGWQGAYIDISIDGGESFSVTIDDNDCIPAPLAWYYNISVTNLGWVNCDYFLGQNANSTLTILTDDEYDCNNTVVYTVFNGEAVVGGTSCNGGTFTSYAMPENTNVTVCALALIDGVYYSAFSDVNVTNNMTESIIFQETSLSDFENTLNNL